MIRSRPIIINSGNATSVSSDGSTLDVSLKETLNVYNKTLRVLQCSFFNNFENVNNTYNNNKFEFVYNAVTYSMTFMSGNYGVDDLNETISEFCMNNSLPITLFNIQPDDSTQLMSLIINTTVATSINFELNNTMLKNALGFTGTASTSVTRSFESTNKATLFKYISVILHISIVGGSNLVYGERLGSDVCASMPINNNAGKICIYSPNYPLQCDVLGSTISGFQVYITDNNGIKLSTNGTPFEVVFDLVDNKIYDERFNIIDY